jgi:hypothetical protein
MFQSASCRLGVGAVLTFAALGLSAIAAESIELAQSASDLTVNLQVLDPEGGDSDPMHLLERQLHRDVKPGGKTYHVLIAVYDATTRQRRADVESVTATLSDGHGQAPVVRLEPMAASGEVGYGNYIDFGAEGPYRISVAVWLRGQNVPVDVEFRLAHLPQ